MSLFSKLVKSPSKLIKSSVNAARNPFNMDAQKDFAKSSLAEMFAPGLSGMIGSRAAQLRGSQGYPEEMQFYQPQMFQAPQQYQSLANLFGGPEFDYSQVQDVYSRGDMPNNALNRFNSLSRNLQSQQAAMIPQRYGTPGKLTERMGLGNYTDFSRLFGGLR